MPWGWSDESVIERFVDVSSRTFFSTFLTRDCQGRGTKVEEVMSELKIWRKFAQTMTYRIVGIYALVAGAYICFSDKLVEQITTDPKHMTHLAITKGLMFVLVTSLLLYYLLKKHLAVFLKQQQELHASEEKFQSIFNSVSDAVFIHDAQTGELLDVNDTMCRMYKCSRAQALHTSADQFSLGESPYSHAEAMAWVQKAAGGQPQTFEWRAKDLHGRLFWSEVMIRRARIGAEDRLVVTVRDIDQRKQADQTVLELERMRAATAQAANTAKDEFLAMVSHELRTPLTPVLLVLSALQNHPNLDADVREDLALACRHVEMESRLIDDLLDLTRIISHKLSLRREPCDLHEVIQSAVSVCRSQYVEKGITLDLQLQATETTLQGDAGRLQQVFWNILGNAVKFTPAGGTVTVSTRVETVEPQGSETFTQPPTRQYFVAEFRDTGIGMTPDASSRIFRMFEQVDQSTTRKFGGLGIGLAVCKAIVDLHHGTIEAISDGPGHGSLITIRLPL